MESTNWIKTGEIHRRLYVLMKCKSYAINSLNNDRQVLLWKNWNHVLKCGTWEI